MASSTDEKTPPAPARQPTAGRENGAPARESVSRRMLMATFVNERNAEKALQAVRARDGYREADVSKLRSNVTREKYFGDDRHEHVKVQMANKGPEGAAFGALVGAILGALAGAFGAVDIGNVIAVPALGVALTGALSSILAGIGTLGTLGGIVGGLVGVIFPEERAVRQPGDFDRGGLVLGLVPHSEEDARHFYEAWDAASGERVWYQEDGAWDLFKGQLLEEYEGTLEDSEIDPYEGHREKLIGHIRERTGASHDAVAERIDRATSREHYDFEAPGGRPRSKPWEAFKQALLDAYRDQGLTEDTLDRHEGQRARLEGHLQETTGQPQRKVEERIEAALRASRYSF